MVSKLEKAMQLYEKMFAVMEDDEFYADTQDEPVYTPGDYAAWCVKHRGSAPAEFKRVCRECLKLLDTWIADARRRRLAMRILNRAVVAALLTAVRVAEELRDYGRAARYGDEAVALRFPELKRARPGRKSARRVRS
jgi:hypothetical protein